MDELERIRTMIVNNVTGSKCDFQLFTGRAEEGFAYYDNNGRIKKTGAAAIDDVNSYLKAKGANPLRSADNRIGMNRHKIVVDQKIGYLFSKPPQFDLPENDEDTGDKELLASVNRTVGPSWIKIIKQLGLDASNTGRGWLAYWADGKTFRYWYVNPLTVCPIYDRSTVKKELQYLIRYYRYADQNGAPVTRYEVWDDQKVTYLIQQLTGECRIDYETLPDGNWNIQPHDYGCIPFIEFPNNAQAVGDLPMYRSIIDALDRLISGFANDIDDLQEIIWVITNYRGETQETGYDDTGNPIEKTVDLLQMLKAKKWVSVDDKGGLEAVHGEIPFEARQAFHDILDAEFWTAAMAVNPNPPTGTGNQSGIYIDYLYGLLELKAGLMETEFRAAIDSFLQAVLHFLGADETKQFVQTWRRTKPQNDTEISQIIAQTPSTVVSDETKTKKHPLVDNWESERARIEKEQQQAQENTADIWPQGHEHDGQAEGGGE